MSIEKRLPAGWITCTVGSVADLIRGVTYDKKDARNKSSEDLFPILRANNINQNINYDELVYLPSKYIKEEQWLHVHDIVIAMSSGSKNLVGKAAQITDISPKSFGAFCGVVRPSNLVEPKYIGYFFHSKYYRDYVSQLSKGVNINNLKREHITDIDLPLAPLNEQKRIVSKIEELFSDLAAGEASLKKAQKLLIRYHQSVLKAALTGELIRANYNNWKQYNIGQLIMDIRYGTAKKCTYDPSKTPVLRIPNVVMGKIDLSALKHSNFTESEIKNLSLTEGDLLLVRSNGSASLVARSAVVGTQAKGFLYAGYLIRLRLKQDKVLPNFLHLFFHSPMARSHIERQARSTSGVHNINSDEIKSLTLRLPSIDEQLEIIDKVDDIFSKIDALESWCQTELIRSAALRQSILKDAFSGKLVLQDPTDESASELLKRIQAEREQQPTGKTQRSKRKEQPTLWETTS